MTDHIGGYFVVMDKSIRDDEIEQTLNALRQIKGVISVEPKVVRAFEEITAKKRFARAAATKLYALAEEILKDT